MAYKTPYPRSMLESSWRRMNPMTKTMKTYGKPGGGEWSKMKPKRDVGGSVPGDGGGCSSLSSKLDKLIHFQDLEQEESTPAKVIRRGITAGGLVGAGYFGLKGHRIIKASGGYKKFGRDIKGAVAKGWSNRNGAELESKLDKLIEFTQGWTAEPSAVVMTPWGGAISYSPKKKEGFKEHLKRSAGKYAGLGTGLAATGAILHSDAKAVGGFKELTKVPGVAHGAGMITGAGLATGAIVDSFRKHHAVGKAVEARADLDIYKMNKGQQLEARLDELIEFTYPIHIKKKNRGKFDATKKKTGETTEELEHSKNKKTRERAVFAENASHWNHHHSDPSKAIEFADPRPRNPLGEFSGQDEGPNPNDMAKVYQSGQHAGIAEGAGGAVAGGLGTLAGKKLLDHIRSIRK